MENNENELLNHNIYIKDRQSISLSGVIKINSFDEEEFVLETTAGLIGIKGKNLEIIKLDTHEGTIIIKGIVISLIYFDDVKMKKENSFISRLFK